MGLLQLLVCREEPDLNWLGSLPGQPQLEEPRFWPPPSGTDGLGRAERCREGCCYMCIGACPVQPHGVVEAGRLPEPPASHPRAQLRRAKPTSHCEAGRVTGRGVKVPGVQGRVY